MRGKGRVFVIGIDGATFRIISPMMTLGRLPNLKVLMESGCRGNLLSTIPALSPVAWTSITTGMNPSRHGIVDFLSFDKTKRSFVFFDSRRRQAKPMWSILSEYGYRVCVVNVPMTYPVDRVNGFMVSGLGTPPRGEDLAYPREIYDEMIKKIGNYSIDINVSIDRMNLNEILQSMRSVMVSRVSAMKFLLGKDLWDFFMIVFTTTDRAQHFFWRFMDPTHPRYEEKASLRYGDVIYEMYERVDSAIGEILKQMTDNDYIIVVSDHGFGSLHRGFSIGRWLWENGYLTVRTDLGGNSPSNIFRFVKRLIPLKIKYLVRKNVFRDRGHHRPILLYLNENIVWEKTRAFCHKMPEATFIYFNNYAVNKKEQVDGLKKELTLKLKEVRDPLTGSNVIKDIIDGQMLFNSEASHIPDVVLVPSDNYDIYFNLYNLGEEPLFQDNTYWSGKHDPEGVFIIYGPNVKRGEEIESIHVVDIAPTVYFLSQVPLGKSLDGKVIKECFTKEFMESHSTVTGRADIFEDADEEGLTADDKDAISKSLRDLGYL
jgi:predicted AlkP superfamily phosphohydrolase/phosphomutase